MVSKEPATNTTTINAKHETKRTYRPPGPQICDLRLLVFRVGRQGLLRGGITKDEGYTEAFTTSSATSAHDTLAGNTGVWAKVVALFTISIEDIKLGDKDKSIADVDCLANSLVSNLGFKIGGGNEAAGTTRLNFFVGGNHIHFELLLR